MRLWRRFSQWAGEGPVLRQRQFYVAYIALFVLTTIILGLTAALVRANRDRIDDIRDALVTSCRQSNEVRSEMRQVIQDVKNMPTYVSWHEDEARWLRLTRAQAHLVDKRCLSP